MSRSAAVWRGMTSANAALASLSRQDQPAYFADVFANLKPSAQDIARAMCIAAVQAPRVGATQTVLNAHLQHKLTQDHVDAQERMARTATQLTNVIVVLTVVTILVQLLTLIQPQRVSVSGRTIVLNISFAGMHIAHWIYLCLAVIGSMIYGFGAFRIHGDDPKVQGWQRLHQYWFNGAGAAVGWLAGWVVLLRWLSCPGYVCRGEPTGWTILLAVLAFVGITGYLPMTIVKAITELRTLLAKLAP